MKSYNVMEKKQNFVLIFWKIILLRTGIPLYNEVSKIDEQEIHYER